MALNHPLQLDAFGKCLLSSEIEATDAGDKWRRRGAVGHLGKVHRGSLGADADRRAEIVVDSDDLWLSVDMSGRARVGIDAAELSTDTLSPGDTGR